jgi:hypothetical protein
MENSAPMAGRAMLMEEAMKGGRNEVRVAMTRAHFLISEVEQVCILGIDGSLIN